MTTAIKKIVITTMLLGTIMVILNILFGNSTIKIITKTEIQGPENTLLNLWWYKIDFYKYFTNVGNQFKSIEKLQLDMPAREWQSLASNPLDVDFWNALLNNMALSLDYIILAINVLLYPIRLAFYLIQCILSLVGVNTAEPTGGLEWLITFNNFMQNNLAIPYI